MKSFKEFREARVATPMPGEESEPVPMNPVESPKTNISGSVLRALVTRFRATIAGIILRYQRELSRKCVFPSPEQKQSWFDRLKNWWNRKAESNFEYEFDDLLNELLEEQNLSPDIEAVLTRMNKDMNTAFDSFLVNLSDYINKGKTPPTTSTEPVEAPAETKPEPIPEVPEPVSASEPAQQDLFDKNPEPAQQLVKEPKPKAEKKVKEDWITQTGNWNWEFTPKLSMLKGSKKTLFEKWISLGGGPISPEEMNISADSPILEDKVAFPGQSARAKKMYLPWVVIRSFSANDGRKVDNPIYTYLKDSSVLQELEKDGRVIDASEENVDAQVSNVIEKTKANYIKKHEEAQKMTEPSPYEPSGNPEVDDLMSQLDSDQSGLKYMTINEKTNYFKNKLKSS